MSLLWLTILFGWFPASASIACVRPILLHADTGESAIPTTRLSRLTKEALFNANNIPAGTITHAYDAVCNRTSRMVQGLGATVDPISNQNLAFDQRDLILGPNGANSGNTNPNYDLNGNSLTDEFGNPTHDLYDAENRLISRGAGQITIGYDEDGHRVFETSGGATTVYLVDDRNPTGYSQVLAEYPGGPAASSANAPTVTYTYGLELICQNRNGVVRFYAYDGQGSVRLLTDATTTPTGGGTSSGTATAVTDTYDYDAYGQLLAQTGNTSNNYRYTGQQWDPALGMYHLRARYYQPGICRLWTMDNCEGNPEQPSTKNAYAYAQADPLNAFDPSGHNAVSLRAAAIGRAVHKMIGEDFIRQNRPFGVAGPSIKSILNVPEKIRRLFPDLVNIKTKAVFEIKPISLISTAIGIAQLEGYIKLLNQFDKRGGGWHKGSAEEYTFYPQEAFMLPVPPTIIMVLPTLNGMIYYQTLNELIKTEVKAVGTSQANDVKDSVGISSLTSFLLF